MSWIVGAIILWVVVKSYDHRPAKWVTRNVLDEPRDGR